MASSGPGRLDNLRNTAKQIVKKRLLPAEEAGAEHEVPDSPTSRVLATLPEGIVTVKTTLEPRNRKKGTYAERTYYEVAEGDRIRAIWKKSVLRNWLANHGFGDAPAGIAMPQPLPADTTPLNEGRSVPLGKVHRLLTPPDVTQHRCVLPISMFESLMPSAPCPRCQGNASIHNIQCTCSHRLVRGRDWEVRPRQNHSCGPDGIG